MPECPIIVSSAHTKVLRTKYNRHHTPHNKHNSKSSYSRVMTLDTNSNVPIECIEGRNGLLCCLHVKTVQSSIAKPFQIVSSNSRSTYSTGILITRLLHLEEAYRKCETWLAEM